MKTLGQKIRHLRISVGISQNELADILGISNKSIQRYESEQSRPDTYSIVKLATYFDVSTDYLLGLKGIRDTLNEEQHKIYQDGIYNDIYKHYLTTLNSRNFDPDSEYYWIYSTDEEIGGQTQWAGWYDEDRTKEIRRLRFVNTPSAIESCIDVNGKVMLINTEKDAIAFRIYGGHAIVRKDICELHLSEFLKDYISERQSV